MAFALEDTSVYREVSQVFASGAKPVINTWECIIHAKVDTTPYRVVEKQVTRNYLNNFFDEIYLDVLMMSGDYIYQVEPYRDILEITLIRTPLVETGSNQDLDREPKVQRYRAVLMSNKSELMEGNRVDRQNQEIANRATMMTVSFQLMDKVTEQLRVISTGGIFRNTSAAIVAKTLLGNASKSLKLEKEISIGGVELAPKYSEAIRDHIVIPQHSQLTLIPKMLHENYGIYAAGFWYYMQAGTWFMYAPYDTERYSQSNRTLTVVNIPTNRMPNIERSYRQTQNQLIVIATGETKYKDQSETDILNDGNSTRFVDADIVTQSFVTTGDNKATTSMRSNIQETTAELRTNKINNIQLSPSAISSNPLFEKSRMARRKGSFVNVSWENANPDLIYPGQPTKYVYEVDGVVHEVFGCVVGATYVDMLNGNNMLANRHLCRGLITLFIQKVVKVTTDD